MRSQTIPKDLIFAFEHFIKDDFEAETFISLQQYEGYFGSPYRFIAFFRQLFKKDYTTFIDFQRYFFFIYCYVENSSSVAERIVFIDIYQKYFKWLIDEHIERLSQEFQTNAVTLQKEFMKVHFFLEGFKQYMKRSARESHAKLQAYGETFERKLVELNPIVLSENLLAENIQHATDLIQMLRGINPRNNMPFIDNNNDFGLILNQTIELIKLGKCPEIAKPIKTPFIPKDVLRFLYYKIHQSIYGRNRREFFFEFLIKFFDCFNEYLPQLQSGEVKDSALYKKFSYAPVNIKHDLPNLKI